MIAWSWTAILIASDLPNIVWRVALHRGAPLWLLYARIVFLGALWVFGTRLPELRTLRPYLLALIAVLMSFMIEDRLFRTPAVNAWVTAVSWRDPVVWSSAVKILRSLAMALTVLSLTRRELFLVTGVLSAPGRIPLTEIRLPWTLLGPLTILVFGAATAALMLGALQPGIPSVRRWVSILPVVLACSAVNAFGEEFTFRSVLLARLQPHVGAEQALWMTSVRFGLGHWFGRPSGPLGALGSTLLGLMLGKSMLETRGMLWAWLVHFTLDVVIFSVLMLREP